MQDSDCRRPGDDLGKTKDRDYRRGPLLIDDSKTDYFQGIEELSGGINDKLTRR